MSRHDLTDAEWNAIRVFLPKEYTGRPGRPWTNHRQIINGILWVLHVGAAWRDVPAEFGKWQTVYDRFRKWSKSGLFDHVWKTLLRRIDQEGTVDRALWCVDGTIVRAHRTAAGGSRKIGSDSDKNALGRSRGGYSTKLHVTCDSNGVPLAITVTPGQINEPREFINLMNSLPLSMYRKSRRPKAMAGDKAYSAGYIRAWLKKRQIRDVIPTRKDEYPDKRFSRKLYRRRNIVERLIGRLKEFRRIATRYDKTEVSYLAMIKLAFLRILLNKHLSDRA